MIPLVIIIFKRYNRVYSNIKMFWFILFILVVGIFVYRAVAQKSNSPSKTLSDLRELAEKFYLEVLEKAKKNYEQSIQNDHNILDSMGIDVVKSNHEHLKRIEKANLDFIRLIERFKREPFDVQLPIYQDWANYYLAHTRINGKMDHLNYTFENEMVDSLFKEIEEIKIEIEEIEKRNTQRLA